MEEDIINIGRDGVVRSIYIFGVTAFSWPNGITLRVAKSIIKQISDNLDATAPGWRDKRLAAHAAVTTNQTTN